MNERDAIRQALDAILGLVQERGLQSFSDQAKEALAYAIEAATYRLEELNRITVQEPGHPPIEPGFVDSSNINGFNYDPETGELYVQFLGDYPNADGPVYKYGGIPEPIAELLMMGANPATTEGENAWGSWWVGKMPSLGSAMYHLIKMGGYPYERVA